jgi:hypothetical protein
MIDFVVEAGSIRSTENRYAWIGHNLLQEKLPNRVPYLSHCLRLDKQHPVWQWEGQWFGSKDPTDCKGRKPIDVKLSVEDQLAT